MLKVGHACGPVRESSGADDYRLFLLRFHPLSLSLPFFYKSRVKFRVPFPNVDINLVI